MGAQIEAQRLQGHTRRGPRRHERRETREWTAPPSIWTLGNVTVFDTLTAACAGGVEVEIEDAALYDGYLSREDLPRDVVNVFTNLRAASLERHLPAFQACQ